MHQPDVTGPVAPETYNVCSLMPTYMAGEDEGAAAVAYRPSAGLRPR
jgi:hypothetical protein